MAKLLSMNDHPNGRKLEAFVLSDFISAIDNRMLILKGIPKELAYNFKVEDKNMLQEWEQFSTDVKMLVEGVDEKDMIYISENEFWRLTYLIYFFGTFYMHNGDDSDKGFVNGSLNYLKKHIGFVYSQGYDIESLFYKAFPK